MLVLMKCIETASKQLTYRVIHFVWFEQNRKQRVKAIKGSGRVEFLVKNKLHGESAEGIQALPFKQ